MEEWAWYEYHKVAWLSADALPFYWCHRYSIFTRKIRRAHDWMLENCLHYSVAVAAIMHDLAQPTVVGRCHG